MTAFADTTVQPDTNGDPTPSTAGMDVSYEVSPTYTVVIPASVTLSATADTTRDITAEDVKLEQGSKIVVTLDEASNTASGTTFHAKIGDSTATYSINDGAIGVDTSNNTIAEFDTKTGDQFATLTFSKAEGATYAGTHTETLTFGIAVKDAAAATKTLTVGDLSINYNDGDTWFSIAEKNDNIQIKVIGSMTKIERVDSPNHFLWKDGSGFSITSDTVIDPTADYGWT